MMINKVTAVGLVLLANSGCSSIMTHTGGNQGYYSGTKANIATLKQGDNGWVATPLIALDTPFSAVLDTLLLPYDYLRSGNKEVEDSPRARIMHAEQQSLAGHPAASGHHKGAGSH